MSCQRGNDRRTRSQSHKNKTAFKNNLHDNSDKQKDLNSLTFSDTCDRCSQILRWRVQYRKYKPLKRPKKCTRCSSFTIRLAYRILCQKCAEREKICPKCCNPIGLDFTPHVVTVQTLADLDADMLKKLRSLPVEKRREFERLILKGKTPTEAVSAAVGPDISNVTIVDYWTREELAIRLEEIRIEHNLLSEDEGSD